MAKSKKPFYKPSFWSNTWVSPEGFSYKSAPEGSGGVKFHMMEYVDEVGSVFVCIDTDNGRKYLGIICAGTMRVGDLKGPILRDEDRKALIVRRLSDFYRFRKTNFEVRWDL